MIDLLEGNYIAVFTDGSSFIDKNNSKYEASSGIVIVINGEQVLNFGCYHVNGTNSLGEIYAMMQGIEKVEELKRLNPELKDYFTIYVSDSEYVVNTLNTWVYSWAKKNGNNSMWKGSTGSPVLYQRFIKYMYYKYLLNDEWLDNNIILHIKGHVKSKDYSTMYNKFMTKNNPQTTKHGRFVRFETFKNLVEYNHAVDSLAEMIRFNKDNYFEERLDTKWEVKRRKTMTRNQRIVIKSKRNENKI